MYTAEGFRKSLKALQEVIHADNKAKGWYDVPRTPLEFHMLMVTEIAEASEEIRKGTPPVYVVNSHDGSIAEVQHVDSISFVHHDGDKVTPIKPEGEAIELADLFIRLLDYAEFRGIDLAKATEVKLTYNRTRAYRHGGKLA